MLEVSFFFCWVFHHHLGSKRCVPCFHFLFCWSMAAWEMIDIVVVLHKQWGEVSKGVLLTKKSPYSFFVIWVAAIKLNGFKFGKFLNQRFVYNKSGCSLSMMERISFNASLGCKGKSGVITTATPSKTSLIAFAIGQLPVAKKPCRNSIFFIVYSSMFCFGVCSALFFIGPE